MRFIGSAICCVVFLGTSVWAADDAAPESETSKPAAEATDGAADPASGESTESNFETDLQRTSYAIGVSIGRGLKKDGAELDAELLGRGIVDALQDNKMLLSSDEVRAAVVAFQKQQKISAIKSAAPADQLAFLKSNAQKDDVVLLYGGLQYRVLVAGDGARPMASDTVKVRYRGTLVDGTEFDKAEDEPVSFGLGGLITGWRMALPRMNVGSKWQLVVPPELAYGTQDKPKIPANSVLIFEIELVGIE